MNGNPNRLNKLSDLTRWNRAGLPRFQYVDGDAAVWLEELRLAVMGLVARSAEMEERLPETWRNRFSQDMDQWPDPGEREAFVEALVWKTLARAYPDRPETARRRNTRLLQQYAQNSGDYGWEIMRAAARASHVLLGHLNAYANEGYLRTATQWDNLVRLASIVNHQPAPPASATTTVGLIVDSTDDGNPVEVDRGLAMKYTAPEGGPPVVFESLEPLKVHPDLNTARAMGWDSDPETLLNSDQWIDDPEADIAPGALAVLHGSTGAKAAIIREAVRDETPGVAMIALTAAGTLPSRGSAVLHQGPKAVTLGAPRSTEGVLVLKIDTASNYPINSVIRLHDTDGEEEYRIIGNADGHLKLDVPSWPDPTRWTHGQKVTVETLVPVSNTGGGNLAPASVGLTAFFINTSGVLGEGTGEYAFAKDEDDNELAEYIGVDFSRIADVIGSFYVPTEGAKRESATVVMLPDPVLPVSNAERRVVSFLGKPPKSLAVGAVYYRRARSTSGDAADQGVAAFDAPLTVAGVAETADGYTIQFSELVTTDTSRFEPDGHDFHGPMTRSLRPVDYNRNPNTAFDGNEITLIGIGAPARELIRLGKPCLVEDETGVVAPVRAVLVESVEVEEEEETGGMKALKLLFEPAEGFTGFLKGWTTLNLNAVMCSHGETKSPKVLGSGDAEKPMQRFPFSARAVSFIPSTVAETGVAPDMDVSVDGVLWSYRDLIDPTADGTESYSVSLTEEGRLVVHFRRRLPTGTDNVVVSRYRTGVGPKGAVPARAFAKPMKKHRYVRALTQPFAATGGADREPVSDLRVNAPARLAANGRAISLRDFERLCRRRSDVWQAWARPLVTPGAGRRVAIVIVPANGGAIGPTLRETLTEFVESRALPGVRVKFEDYVPIRLKVTSKIRVDIEKFDKTQIEAAAQAALIAEFSLENRGLGQPVYISEIAAALERVEGVATATVPEFAVDSASALQRTAMTGGAPSAYFPFDNQVIFAAPETAGADINVQV